MGILKFGIPKSEIQVREWFAAHITDFSFDILESNDSFPDYILQDENGRKLRAEVEFKSSNFIYHKHDPALCDIVICWSHDSNLSVPVWELSTGRVYESGEFDPDYIDPSLKSLLLNAERKREKLIAIISDELQTDYEEFIERFTEDLKVQSKLQHSMYKVRLKLLQASEKLMEGLRQEGIELKDLHPYDLFTLITERNRSGPIYDWITHVLSAEKR